jgi:hypothetical protein
MRCPCRREKGGHGPPFSKFRVDERYFFLAAGFLAAGFLAAVFLAAGFLAVAMVIPLINSPLGECVHSRHASAYEASCTSRV